MDSAINFSVSPAQALLALAFQVWLIVFPIMIIRKLNHLTTLLEEHLGPRDEDQGSGEASV